MPKGTGELLRPSGFAVRVRRGVAGSPARSREPAGWRHSARAIACPAYGFADQEASQAHAQEEAQEDAAANPSPASQVVRNPPVRRRVSSFSAPIPSFMSPHIIRSDDVW